MPWDDKPKNGDSAESDPQQAAEAADDCVADRRVSARHPKLQDFHGRRQQREAEGNRNPSGPCPKPKRQSRMLDHAWQAGVGAISARNERQNDNGQNAELACCPNNGDGKRHEPNPFPFTRQYRNHSSHRRQH